MRRWDDLYLKHFDRYGVLRVTVNEPNGPGPDGLSTDLADLDGPDGPNGLGPSEYCTRPLRTVVEGVCGTGWSTVIQ